MNAIYRSIPNCLLQLYIVFVVAESTGTFSFIVVLSCGLGLVSMSALFYILFDRADIRLLSFAPTHSNPRIATFISGLFFQDNIKELSNYNVSILASILCLLLLQQFDCHSNCFRHCFDRQFSMFIFVSP